MKAANRRLLVFVRRQCASTKICLIFNRRESLYSPVRRLPFTVLPTACCLMFSEIPNVLIR
jgi:hypothetical protein